MDYLAFILSLFFYALVPSDGNIKGNDPAESATLSDIMNGILNVRVDLLSLKEKVDSNKNAIEKVQQKVDSNRNAIQNLKDSSINAIEIVQQKVDSNMNAIQNVQRKVDSNVNAIEKVQVDLVFVKEQVNDNGKGINGFGGVVAFSEGGHVAKKFYDDYKISFIGYGYATYRDNYVDKYVDSFSQCVEYCRTVREERGTSWDGIQYALPDKHCFCDKRGRGHLVHQDWVHYHFF